MSSPTAHHRAGARGCTGGDDKVRGGPLTLAGREDVSVPCGADSGSAKGTLVRIFLAGFAALTAAATLTTLTIGPATAAPATECTGSVTGGSLGPLVVPSGATCTLNDVVVDGNIRIDAGGALITDDSTLNGSVTARGARTVRLIDTDVIGTGTAGNVHLTGTTGRIVIGSQGCAVDPSTGNNIILVNNHGTIAICYMTVGETVALRDNDKTIGVFHNEIGNPLIVQNNTAGFIRIRDNEVGTTGGGSMVVQNNHTTGNATTPDGLRLLRNYSHNRLNCTGNDDAPVGTGNTADNGKLGQCATL
jgi:hypothetical protein